MSKKLKILHIEDDVIEGMKFQKILSSLKLGHSFIGVNSSEEAEHLLVQKDRLPDIIVLDLNMPKINGLEFLEKLRTTDSWKYIPVIILTTSSNPKDLLACYNLGVSGYLLKLLDYDECRRRLSTMLNYWSMNELVSQ